MLQAQSPFAPSPSRRANVQSAIGGSSASPSHEVERKRTYVAPFEKAKAQDAINALERERLLMDLQFEARLHLLNQTDGSGTLHGAAPAGASSEQSPALAMLDSKFRETEVTPPGKKSKKKSKSSPTPTLNVDPFVSQVLDTPVVDGEPVRSSNELFLDFMQTARDNPPDFQEWGAPLLDTKQLIQKKLSYTLKLLRASDVKDPLGQNKERKNILRTLRKQKAQEFATGSFGTETCDPKLFAKRSTKPKKFNPINAKLLDVFNSEAPVTMEDKPVDGNVTRLPLSSSWKDTSKIFRLCQDVLATRREALSAESAKESRAAAEILEANRALIHQQTQKDLEQAQSTLGQAFLNKSATELHSHSIAKYQPLADQLLALEAPPCPPMSRDKWVSAIDQTFVDILTPIPLAAEPEAKDWRVEASIPLMRKEVNHTFYQISVSKSTVLEDNPGVGIFRKSTLYPPGKPSEDYFTYYTNSFPEMNQSPEELHMTCMDRYDGSQPSTTTLPQGRPRIFRKDKMMCPDELYAVISIRDSYDSPMNVDLMGPRMRLIKQEPIKKEPTTPKTPPAEALVLMDPEALGQAPDNSPENSPPIVKEPEETPLTPKLMLFFKIGEPPEETPPVPEEVAAPAPMELVESPEVPVNNDGSDLEIEGYEASDRIFLCEGSEGA
jgi:hypothetical protein